MARHDPNKLAHKYGVSKSLEIRNLANMHVILLYLRSEHHNYTDQTEQLHVLF